MDFSNPLFLISIIMGICYALFGWIMIKYPPKWPNYLYGYRTVRAMKNEKNWVFAQRYSAKEMMKTGIIYIVIAVLCPLIPAYSYILITIALIVMVTLLVYPIISTERALKRFEDEKNVI